MNINEIMQLLPHKYPLLLVDRVLGLVPHESIVAYKNISINEDVFNGHFPISNLSRCYDHRSSRSGFGNSGFCIN